MNNTLRHFMFTPKVSVLILGMFVVFAMTVTWGAITMGQRAKPIDSRMSAPLGQEVRKSGISLRVESVRTDTIGAGPLKPHEGNIFVIPTVTIANDATSSYDLIPLLQLHLKDSQGNVYNTAAVPTEGNQLSGTILPNDKLREEVGFEVAKDARNLVLYFDVGNVGQSILTEQLF